MEDKKKARGLYCKEQKGAVLMIRAKGELTYLTEKKFTLPEIKTLLKWKKVKITSSKKADLVEAYVNAPRPKIQKVWCRDEEEKLQALKNMDVPIKDTALGVATEQMARAVTNNLSNLNTPTRKSLKSALADYDEGNPDRII